jgi:hypothetical protein
MHNSVSTQALRERFFPLVPSGFGTISLNLSSYDSTKSESFGQFGGIHYAKLSLLRPSECSHQIFLRKKVGFTVLTLGNRGF